MVENKRGWLRVFESTIAVILLLGTVLLLYQNKNVSSGENDYILDFLESTLDTLSKNSSLRIEILDDDTPQKINVDALIKYNAPSSFGFSFTVCNLTSECILVDTPSDKSIYFGERIIAGNIDQDKYSTEWRLIKLALWREG